MTRFDEVLGAPRGGSRRPDLAAGRRHGFAVRTCSEGIEYCFDAVEAFLEVLDARREGKAEVALTRWTEFCSRPHSYAAGEQTLYDHFGG
jgi:hypothetical protein